MSLRPSTLFAFVLTASGIIAAVGCEFIASADRTNIPDPDAGVTTGIGGAGATGGAGGTGTAGAGTGAAGGTGGMAGMGGGTGGTGGAECTLPADCGGADTDCKKRTCEMGMCGFMNVGMGMACDEMGGKKCDGMGECVECLVDMDCMVPLNDTCDAQHKCVPGECANLAKDGLETDIDCGGLMCSKCADTKMCLLNTDCQSDVCMTTCQAPSCMDATKNGDETDVDCGGSCPVPKCADNKGCITAADCQSGVCSGGNLCSVPTCMDGVQNGTETAVDCGGTCGKCDDDVCAVDGDCKSLICDNLKCGLNGCTLATAVDITATPTVTFGGVADGNNYNPKCFKVDAGTTVTFSANVGADFVAHPLVGGKIVAPATKVPQGAPNPFNPITSTGMSAMFDIAGASGDRYGFYCNVHGPLGMKGAAFIK